MRNKMAKYTMISNMRQGGGNRNEMRRGGNQNEMRNEMRGGYDEMENRFRDRRGREHYDNGRFAPMRNEWNEGTEMRRGGNPNEYHYEPYDGNEYRGEMRRGREGGGNRSEMRREYEDEERKMNQIGFERPREMPEYSPARIESYSGDEMSSRGGSKTSGGAMGAEGEFTEDMAKEWTRKMHNEDGTKGEHWNMEQVKKLMTQRGVQYNTAEVYAIMNALYSDYCKVFKKYGFNSPEAYLDLAIAWLNDSDSVDNKAMAYYEHVVKH